MFRLKKNRNEEEKPKKEKSPYSILRWRNLKKATPEDEARFREQMQENNVGFKDGLAMALAALLVIVLPAILILLACCFLAMLLLGVF